MAKPKAYITHPYGGKVENIFLIKSLINTSSNKAFEPYAPWVERAQTHDDNIPEQRAKAFVKIEKLIKNLTPYLYQLWVYGSHISAGMLQEIKWAKQAKIKIVIRSTTITAASIKAIKP